MCGKVERTSLREANLKIRAGRKECGKELALKRKMCFLIREAPSLIA